MSNEKKAMTEATFYILLSLHQPMHGYGIILRIKDLSHGRVVIGSGTLYGALDTLQEKGYIKRYTPINDEKKEYLITDTGKEVLSIEIERLKELLDNAKSIMTY